MIRFIKLFYPVNLGFTIGPGFGTLFLASCILFISVLSSCGPSSTPENRKYSAVDKEIAADTASKPLASDQTHRFFEWWIGQAKGAPIGLTDQLRNKLITRTDVAELNKYMVRNGISETTFDDPELLIIEMRYARFDKARIHVPVQWIDHNKLRGCRKISRAAMFECLKYDYNRTDYYYVSSPIFSKDGKYAVVSINYMEDTGEDSKGSTSLFKLKGVSQGREIWEEIAILTYWGKFREIES